MQYPHYYLRLIIRSLLASFVGVVLIGSSSSSSSACITESCVDQDQSRSFEVGGLRRMTDDHLYNPAARDAHYNGNMAQYLVDLHDSKATFNFW